MTYEVWPTLWKLISKRNKPLAVLSRPVYISNTVDRVIYIAPMAIAEKKNCLSDKQFGFQQVNPADDAISMATRRDRGGTSSILVKGSEAQ